jgi:hypothetical protein
MNAESISRTLAPGTYYVRSNFVSGDGTYTLGMSFTPTAGAADGGGGTGDGDGAAEDGPATTPPSNGHGHAYGWDAPGGEKHQSAASELLGDGAATALPQ